MKTTNENGYIATYKGRRTEIYAETSYKAQQLAAAFFKAKKSWEVTVYLCEHKGKDVINATDF